MKSFWNERYSEAGYVYGKAPNAFLEAQMPGLQPARALFPAEGEGRNAVYAASLGWQVSCFDYSEAGRKKALALAAEKGTTIDYEVCDLQEYAFPEEAFALVGLFFAHLPPESRKYLHTQCYRSLLPGGFIILEAFAKEQLNYQSGGPKQEAMLYSAEILQADFPGLEVLSLAELQTNLSEGPYHHGPAQVVRLIGQKPAIQHLTH